MKPDEITKEQLYKLLHVSKRKAKWMLDEGIIPCVNRGTKTHTYLIRMEDVQIYLERSDVERRKEIPTGTSTQSLQKATEKEKPSRRSLYGRRTDGLLPNILTSCLRMCRMTCPSCKPPNLPDTAIKHSFTGSQTEHFTPCVSVRSTIFQRSS